MDTARDGATATENREKGRILCGRTGSKYVDT